jgi:hypothetical protein
MGSTTAAPWRYEFVRLAPQVGLDVTPCRSINEAKDPTAEPKVEPMARQSAPAESRRRVVAPQCWAGLCLHVHDAMSALPTLQVFWRLELSGFELLRWW